MQFQFRIDDNNCLTFDIRVQAAGSSGFETGPELVAAVISDSKLSNISEDAIIGLAADIVDFFSVKHPVSTGPSPDWFENEWLPATAAHEKGK